MFAQAKKKNIRVTPRKLRRTISLIRGKSVNDAFNILSVTNYASVHEVRKLLINAVANAVNIHKMDSSRLVVSEIYADEASSFKRFKPRAQGRIYPVHKDSSHLTISLAYVSGVN